MVLLSLTFRFSVVKLDFFFIVFYEFYCFCFQFFKAFNFFIKASGYIGYLPFVFAV